MKEKLLYWFLKQNNIIKIAIASLLAIVFLVLSPFIFIYVICYFWIKKLIKFLENKKEKPEKLNDNKLNRTNVDELEEFEMRD